MFGRLINRSLHKRRKALCRPNESIDPQQGIKVLCAPNESIEKSKVLCRPLSTYLHKGI